MSSRPASLRRILIILGLLILPSLTLAASDGAIQARSVKTARETQPDASQASTVSIIDFAFQPKVITITVGTSVRWTNNGSFIHTSTSDTGIWDSTDIPLGESYTMTFTTLGDFPYHCMHHPTIMMGKVVVMGDTFLPIVTR